MCVRVRGFDRCCQFVRISVQARFVDGSGLNCLCSPSVRWRFGSDSVRFACILRQINRQINRLSASDLLSALNPMCAMELIFGICFQALIYFRGDLLSR